MLLLGLISTAQVKKDAVNAKNIAINWQIIENSHAGGGKYISSLIVKNKPTLAL
jgi:hexosaminidase